MLIAKGKIRTEVIPDLQVKILALCLSDDENGINPRISTDTKLLSYKADEILRETIQNKIKKSKQAIASELNFGLMDKLAQYEVLPITMRKHLLYKDCRAG